MAKSSTKEERIDFWLTMAPRVHLSEWLINLFPAGLFRHNTLRSAAIVGALRGGEVTLGQMSCYGTAYLTDIYFYSRKEAELIEGFARKARLSKFSTIIRTAIMLGLPLKEVEKGVISPTREEQFTEEELAHIIAEAKKISGYHRDGKRDEMRAARKALRDEGLKKCFKCGETKSERKFWGDKSRYDGLTTMCAECLNTYRRMLWARNCTHREEEQRSKHLILS